MCYVHVTFATQSMGYTLCTVGDGKLCNSPLVRDRPNLFGQSLGIGHQNVVTLCPTVRIDVTSEGVFIGTLPFCVQIFCRILRTELPF